MCKREASGFASFLWRIFGFLTSIETRTPARPGIPPTPIPQATPRGQKTQTAQISSAVVVVCHAPAFPTTKDFFRLSDRYDHCA
jgi:hypothetical protein